MVEEVEVVITSCVKEYQNLFNIMNNYECEDVEYFEDDIVEFLLVEKVEIVKDSHDIETQNLFHIGNIYECEAY